MGKILYLECNSGISGDMTVGALLDLGADRRELERALESLGVGGYHLHFGRTKKCGLDAFDFDVHLEECGEGHGHTHEHEGHVHEHGDHIHEHGGTAHEHDSHAHAHGDHVHEHDSHVHVHEGPAHGDHAHMACEGDHVHPHVHDQPDHHHQDEHHSHHPHVHRNYMDVCRIIDRLDSGERVKELAKRMFRIVAEAESKAHGLPIDEVHFHEVGAIDSIVDIIGVAVCLDNLGIEDVVVSPLAEGSGYVRCQHGVIPIPVPATANIAAAHGLTLRLTDNEGEMVTPTGAAIAAALRTMDRLPAACRIVKTGMGAGKKDFKQANVLRAMILETEAGAKDQMWVLESNIDDCTGEMLGFSMERLLAAGAADVWATPIFMKKNRPAYMMSVLCREEKLGELEAMVLMETTTIGVRKYPVNRTVMERSFKTVDTLYGPAQVKVCSFKGKTFFYPEYEDVRRLCLEHGLDFKSVYDEIKRQGESAR